MIGGACWQTRCIELPTLTDGQITLRPRHESDLDALVAACQDPEIPRWTSVPSPYTRADAEAHHAATANDAAEGRAVRLFAVDARDDTLLGSISLLDLDREPGYAEIGYWVVAEARGRRVATRAVELLTAWGHDVLGLDRIEVIAHRDNLPSRRVAERAGFADTGELRAHPRSDSTAEEYAVYVSVRA
jgi:RimJ/RimL family protein N-acetyltransferase